jgi:hypothetical protein
VSREETQRFMQVAAAHVGSCFRWRMLSAFHRRVALAGIVSAGCLVSAWGTTLMPACYQASASFDHLSSAADGQVNDAGWPCLSGLVPTEAQPYIQTLRAVETALSATESRTTVIAEAPSAAWAAQLALAGAECRRAHYSNPSPAPSSALAQAQREFENADQAYREALAAWGEEEPEPEFDDGVQMVSGESSSASLMTTPSLLPAHRQKEQTQIDQAIHECSVERDRLAELYTDEHPAVIELDRQLAYLL